MLYYDRIDFSEVTDVNKTNESKESDICNYWYFLDKGFKFQPDDYNGCYDVLMMFMNLSNIISNINCVGYHCIISGISKSETINLM